MTNTQSILIGAAMIAAAIIVSHGGGIGAAEAQTRASGPFQLMHHSNTVANAGVFRLDVSTGEVSYCFIGSDQNLNCTREVK